MRLLQVLPALAALALAGCGGKHVETAAPGVPFMCADGRPLRVVYDGGGMRARAQLLFDGARHDMMAAPGISGLRYTSETGLSEGQALVWTTDGIHGALAEVPAAQAGLGEEREVVRCTRLGWDGETGAADASAEDHHGDDH